MKVKHTQSGIAGIISELRMAVFYIKANIYAAAELRVSFVMQVVGMMLNNTTFIIIWLLFFTVFGSINGWGGIDVIALQGFIAVIFGIAYAFFAGVRVLPQAINNGVFDSVLLTPRMLYLRILTLGTATSAIGDILYGLLCLGIYCVLAGLSFVQIFLLFSLLIPATIILINFALIAACVGFLLPDADDLVKNIVELLMGPSMYPPALYQGGMRFFFLFIIPAISVAGLPVESVKHFDLGSVGIVWLLAGMWTVLGIWVLHQGVKHYESGNLTGARI